MNQRQKLLLRFALAYLMANLEDFQDTMRIESDDPNHPAYGREDMIESEGEILPQPTESELLEVYTMLPTSLKPV